MEEILFWLYLANTLTLIGHEIDSAYWKEWELFRLPGGEAGFALVHFPLLFPLLFGLVLIDRGELSEGVVVRSLVPISVRSEDERGVITNRVSAVLANLPVGEPDPMRRLELLRDQMDDLKRTRQAVGAELLTEMLGFAAPTLLALGSRAAFQLPQPLVQTVTTNVPGPRFPLFILGRRMVEAYPYVPIGDNVRISIAIYSYLDRFSFGITADYSAAPDLDVLTTGIRRGLSELQAQSTAIRRGGVKAPPRRRPGTAAGRGEAPPRGGTTAGRHHRGDVKAPPRGR